MLEDKIHNKTCYLQRVTPWNVHQMREAAENGPELHPGATHVEDEAGRIIGLDKLPKHKRSALAKMFLSTLGMAVRGTNVGAVRLVGMTVYRHLRDGDVLLVNHQVGQIADCQICLDKSMGTCYNT